MSEEDDRAGQASFEVAALLLDLDGVLVDSIATVEQAWREWAEERELDVESVLVAMHGRPATEAIRQCAPHLDAVAETERIEQRELDHTDQVSALPGAAALLGELPDGAWAIVTSGTRRLATARLRATGLSVPEVLITADDVDQGKPAPDPYLLAADRLAADPAGCLVVEDAPAGVAAASAAGMAVVAVTTSHAAGDVADADVVVEGVAALTVSSGADGMLLIQAVTAP
ncbi:MAG: HAD-IA family hydrolase [Egibacteraceae bacterium]